MGRGLGRARGLGALGCSLTEPIPPGSLSQCLAAASAAFAEVERRLHAGGPARARLRQELGACGRLGSAADRAELLGALQAVVGGAVQYDGQARTPLGVRRLCALLLAGAGRRTSAPYGGLRRAVQVSTWTPCFPGSSAGSVRFGARGESLRVAPRSSRAAWARGV